MTDRRTEPSSTSFARHSSFARPSSLRRPSSRGLTPSRVAALVAATTLVAAVPAWGQQPEQQQPAGPESVLPGRPTPVAKSPAPATPAAPAREVTDLAAALDAPFRSESAGIALRPPAGGKIIRRAGGGDEVARFVSDEQKWRFVISRVTLEEGVPLTTLGSRIGATTAPAADATRPPGFADSIAQQMPNDTPGTFVRYEFMPINGYDGAILAACYREAGINYLMQQAVIRRTDKHYYVLSYTTPLGSAAGPVAADPLAVRAVDTFGSILDSVELIDGAEVRRNQEDRLIHTRSMLVNWTADRLRNTIVGEQWLRLIKDGKDVGYTYIVEELANDVPRAGGVNKNERIDPAKALGVRVGVRSRTMIEPGQRVDAESWMWVSFDRGQEAFSNVAIVNARAVDAKGNVIDPKAEPTVDYSMERGTSIRRDRIVPRVEQNPGGIGTTTVGRKDDRYDLQLWATAKRVALPPVKRELPPFYLPQALCHLLPRILPSGELAQPKEYLFASYVPERRDVMLRYVEVLPVTSVDLGGRLFTAVPVRERIGLEGSITTHYVTPGDRKYLGSVNEDNKITVVTTDAETLTRIWADADLQRPGAVDDATASPTTDAPKPAPQR